MLYMYCLGLMIVGIDAENMYNVIPDDKGCSKHPCLYLSYLIDNHQDYFTSNTMIIFSETNYYIFADMIVQNVFNFSLISFSLSEIVCSPQRIISFHNVVNLTIKSMLFTKCGNSINNSLHQAYWASMFFDKCTNVHIKEVYISDPVGYGIIAYNMLGYNIIENFSVHMGRQKQFESVDTLLTCSYGLHFNFFDSDDVHMQTSTTTSFVTASEISLTMPSNFERCKSCCGLNYYQIFRTIFEIYLKQNDYDVVLTIMDSSFSHLIGNIMTVSAESLANNSISFNNFKITEIRNLKKVGPISQFEKFMYSQRALSFYYRIQCDYLIKILLNFHVSFVDCVFSHNDCDDKLGNDAIIHVAAEMNYNYENKSVMLITFKNVIFCDNLFVLLNIASTTLPMYYEPLVSVVTKDKFTIYGNMNEILIHFKNVQVHFRGVTNFFENMFSTIVYSDSSKLIFTNATAFHRNNDCIYLLNLNGRWLYIVLAEHANFTISFNELENEIISVSEVYNNPFPFCIFQFNSSLYQNYSIYILNNTERSVNYNRSNSTINRLTLNCKLNTGRKINHFNDSLLAFKQVIKYSNLFQYHQYTSSVHTDICYCPTLANYNCSVNWLGKGYPGQALIVDLCLPYNNEESRVLWIESFNDYLPPTSCKVYSLVESKQTFYGTFSKKVNITVASDHLSRCELFLTAQPNLYTRYDAFYIQMLPCPLGFALHKDTCDCDPQLGPYTEKCMINYQAVQRLPNCWISSNTRDNSTKYYVSNNCPVSYCSQVISLINVQKPDTQCQQHRTGILCSQCKVGYSLVLGSSRCKKCSNAHLAFIALVIFNGIVLFIIIFLLNLTVTVGTLNAVILYTHIIQINDFPLHLQSRLTKPLYFYIEIASLGSYFEMCVYDGMNMYAKKWIQLVYPTYVILIACLFIVVSRYSKKLFWLTHKRSLPVLATIFVLIYTNVLQTISDAFLYTTITSLPSKQFCTVWYLDPNVKLFGWKFLLLLIACLILLLLLLILNTILLFTKTLMRFSIIHRLKPFIDALQGPFKNQCCYWLGAHLLIRNAILLISLLEEHLCIAVGCIVMIIGALIHSYIQPYKNKMINIQEMLLFCNYIILCVLLLSDGGEVLSIVALNVLIGLSFLQFMLIILYHMYTFVLAHYCTRVQDCTKAVWIRIKALCWQNKQNYHNNENIQMEIPVLASNYSEFQEPLLGLD